MTHNTNIKRRNDGSIDCAHYASRGHQIRSLDAHKGLAAIWRAVKKIALAIKSNFLQRSSTGQLQVTSHPLEDSINNPAPIGSKADNDNTTEASKEFRAIG